MKTFNQFILESGNAVKNVTTISQENVPATLKTIYTKLLPKLKIGQADIRTLGSTGKKLPGNHSGDIDLAVDISAVIRGNKIEDVNDIIPFIGKVSKKLSPSVAEMKGINIVSLAWPIENTDGKQPDSFVQLDLMLVEKESLNFAAWSYWSPKQEESKYKGLHRNALLFAILQVMDYKIMEKALDKQGVEVPSKWERIFLDSKVGLMKGIQSNIGKTGLATKTKKTLSRKIVSTSPIQIIHTVLGPDFDIKDTNSFETILKAIKSPKFIYKDRIDKIFKAFKADMVKKGRPIPKELL